MVVGGSHEPVRPGEELVDPRHHVVIGEKGGHALLGPPALDELNQRELGAQRVPVGGRVRAHGYGGGALHQARDLIEARALARHELLSPDRHGPPYSPSAAGASSSPSATG